MINSNRIVLLLITTIIGFFIYKQIKTYNEMFANDKKQGDNNPGGTVSANLNKIICNDPTYQEITNRMKELQYHSKNGSFGPSYSKGQYNSLQNLSYDLIKKYPQLEDDFRPIINIRNRYFRYAYNGKDEFSLNWNQLPPGISHSSFLNETRKYFNETIILFKNINDKFPCFGQKTFNYNTLMQKLKQLQGILLKNKIEKSSIDLFNKISNEITTLINTAKQGTFTDTFNDDLNTIFFIKDKGTPVVLKESYFKRKGTAKKITNWINFIKNKKAPIKGYNYNILDTTSTNSTQTPLVTTFTPLKIVSAGSFNAEQEQMNLPKFDIKDKGGYNLFRAVVVKDDIPIVSKSYSIKDSCTKEKKGIPLDLGNTPLILKNYARGSSLHNNKYDSSQYFSYPKLLIIENMRDDGKNLNNETKTYYLSYSGNTTKPKSDKETKEPLYHIRTYNPNTGKFDYAFDIGSTGKLQKGMVNNSLQTSLFLIKPSLGDDGLKSIVSYGYKGFGETAGQDHYFVHKFNAQGREIEELSIEENKTWDLKQITI